jgi:hypothetical protein
LDPENYELYKISKPQGDFRGWDDSWKIFQEAAVHLEYNLMGSLTQSTTNIDGVRKLNLSGVIRI